MQQARIAQLGRLGARGAGHGSLVHLGQAAAMGIDSLVLLWRIIGKCKDAF